MLSKLVALGAMLAVMVTLLWAVLTFAVPTVGPDTITVSCAHAAPGWYAGQTGVGTTIEFYCG